MTSSHLKSALFALLAIVLPTLGWCQTEEEVVTEKDLRKSFNRAYAAMIRGNIHGWGDFYDGEIPEHFAELTHDQRSMLQWEPLAPGIPVWEMLQSAMDLQPGDTLVDFGCGMAHLESILLTYGMDEVTVYGLDIDPFCIELAPRFVNWTLAFIDYYNASMNVLDTSLAHALHRPVDFTFHPILSTPDNAGFPTHGTNKLMCIRTLHHLDEAETAKMVSLVRPGGYLYIVDNLAPKSGKRRCTDADAVYYLTEAEIVAQMEQAGCTKVSVEYPSKGSGVFVFQRN
jgi:SAM-dependent methyltransferase